MSPHRIRKKSPPKRLIVRINGLRVKGGNATAVFLEALGQIGLDRIAGLDLRLSGAPLVSRSAPAEARRYRISGGWYVATHSDTLEKRQVLERIARELSIDLQARIMEYDEWKKDLEKAFELLPEDVYVTEDGTTL